ncbi:RimJ/RimL family protein N-acetyltransferase [Crossiella equi]|uniref:RimJ/RimL family protein N-acetyltransferase n=1 Tax=Crossiella equi TaxID=130796 RepID=A0ABS5AFL3_9PSEU|nr:GNAT family protein [Crossiella equi]MBP2475363.1 RimJ/RimL family protein N-acetyltransferase [Crossiella equi]
MDPWPLRHLVLRTPRLELRPDDDESLHELAELVTRGVHPPGEMPFISPWTELPPGELERGVFQFRWLHRARFKPEEWNISFTVRHEGRVIGSQDLSAKDFAIRREVRSGSWLGLAHQGQGFGTEMRAAVLAFAFDHLGATTAGSEAFSDNARSLGVSRRLGYRENGIRTVIRKGEAATEIGLRLTREEFRRPDWTVQVEGLDGCRSMLGI